MLSTKRIILLQILGFIIITILYNASNKDIVGFGYILLAVWSFWALIILGPFRGPKRG